MVLLLIYFFGFVLLAMLALLLFIRAVSSRKQYVCPHCGERLTVELMSASRCNMCGAPLRTERD
jgi:hypothetical protein